VHPNTSTTITTSTTSTSTTSTTTTKGKQPPCFHGSLATNKWDIGKSDGTQLAGNAHSPLSNRGRVFGPGGRAGGGGEHRAKDSEAGQAYL